MNDVYYIYAYSDPQKLETPFYIGKGKNQRAWDHLVGKSSSKRVQDKITQIRSRGMDPVVMIIEQNLSEEDAYLKEAKWISKLGRRGFDSDGCLLNICKGKEPPRRIGPMPISTRIKISQATRGKSKGRLPWNKGKTHKRGPQTAEQTQLIMETRLIRLANKILQHFDTVDRTTIRDAKSQGIIAKNSPLSEQSMQTYLGVTSLTKTDMFQYSCASRQARPDYLPDNR